MPKAYLIDPETQEITLVTHPGDFKAIQKLLQVSIFTSVALEDSDLIYVDDEGLLKSPTLFFQVNGYSQPLAGRGLVIGSDDEGNDTDPVHSLDWVKDNVTFLEGEQHNVLRGRRL